MDNLTRKLARALSKINGLCQKWHTGGIMNSARQQVLIALAMEGTVSQKDIVNHYMIPKQTVSQEILAMKKEGLLELRPDENDRREKKIVITEKGTSYMERVLTPYFDMLQRIETRMKPQLFDQMVEGMRAYAMALEEEVLHGVTYHNCQNNSRKEENLHE